MGSRQATYNRSSTHTGSLAAAPPPLIMQTQTHPLISPAVGTERQITSFHYGPRGGKKVYIQSSLHADEL
ncbi:MAG TPA: succinylglutamate desuccinylase, partial [Burkholderia sp.]|nr:succinylglutamate desuccinylase [Burkholderia sp.]